MEIRIIADKNQAARKNSEIDYLISSGIDVKLLKGKGRTGIMHNKFAVFDEKEVITGSYNWTYNAEENNFENELFIKDPSVVKQYINEFNRLYSKS